MMKTGSVIDQLTWSGVVSPAPIPDPTRNFFQSVAPTDVVVAVNDGRVQGYIQIQRSSDLASNAHVWEIRGLAVDPESQRAGLGTQLVSAAIPEINSRGGLRVTLRVLAANSVAQRLYANCGFDIEGVLRSEFILEGEEVDDVLMARRCDNTD